MSAAEGRPSLRAAIDAMCKSCLYDPEERGGWRQQVEACAVTRCKLYPVRTGSRSSS